MGISPWQLAIIFAIVVLLFGTKRLKNIGSDLGGAIKGFKKAIDDKPVSTLEDQRVLQEVESNKVNATKP